MKIAFIGTYPPRRCGIGTFTHNLVRSVSNNISRKRFSQNISVIALNESIQNGIEYPEEVKFTIRQNHQRDYIEASRFINFSEADVCILQHEFGIFGGDDGVYILPLLHRLQIPLIVTFHTVLRSPSHTQRSIIEEIGKKASRIVVMSRHAVHFLTEIYGIPSEKILIIEHGVPEFEKISRKAAKQKLKLSGRKVLFTFGLLSRNKGIETAIHSLVPVVKKHPDLLYIVLGATHPAVLKHSGEEYREYLWRMVKSLGLENNVYFLNKFTPEDTLFEYLNACDIYITPYLSEAQITSGTLAYAIGAGCAVVSTPYWHAKELLDEGRGRLFGFKNSQELGEIMLELLDSENKLAGIRNNAYEFGKKTRWSKTAKQYYQLAEMVVRNHHRQPVEDMHPIDLRMLPLFNLDHIKRLTDNTGIIQHAKYGIPNLREGYCVDDNSRALLLMLMAYRQNKEADTLNLMYTYLSFLHYMQRENGNFRNHISFSREFLDEYGSEDSFGRTIWALGYLICHPPNDAFRQIAAEMFSDSIQHFQNLKTVRGAANTIIGITYYLKQSPNDEQMVQQLKALTEILISSYKENASDQWGWFEEKMTYDNAILPLALLHCFEITGEREVFEIAVESTGFLESKTLSKGFLIPVGNQGWLQKGQQMPEYDQQPLEVMAMVLLYYQYFILTKNTDHITTLFNCYLWFLGENSLRLPLFDNETYGCCDGLEIFGVNRNQGAESTLAFWISHASVLAAQQQEHFFYKEQNHFEMDFTTNGNNEIIQQGNFWNIWKSMFRKNLKPVGAENGNKMIVSQK
jgi:glycosyltransferase involved in cell wall biosynthesis